MLHLDLGERRLKNVSSCRLVGNDPHIQKIAPDHP